MFWIDVFMNGNMIVGNDMGIVSFGVNDFLVVNVVGGMICLVMLINFFIFVLSVINNNVLGNFIVELDGVINGLGVLNFVGGVGGFNVVGFGIMCELVVVV